MMSLLKMAATVWFFLTFCAVLAWTFLQEPPHMEICKYLPLEDDHAASS
ncbi:MAG TPA: hypothetical protein VGO93_31445 [Candidatus Xenobia bacterium]|jgi:hypothetical protein